MESVAQDCTGIYLKGADLQGSLCENQSLMLAYELGQLQGRKCGGEGRGENFLFGLRLIIVTMMSSNRMFRGVIYISWSAIAGSWVAAGIQKNKWMLIKLIQRNCYYLTNHESMGKIISCVRNVDVQMRARKDSNTKLLISKINRGERKEYELFKTTVRKKNNRKQYTPFNNFPKCKFVQLKDIDWLTEFKNKTHQFADCQKHNSPAKAS